jgi:hypothetical protein
MVVLIGIAGLGVDMGVLRYEKRIQQTAADAAAIAGADNLAFPLNSGVVEGGQNASATNGFTDNGSGDLSTCTASGAAVGTVCVQINNPPLSGPHATNGGAYVEAYVSEVHETYFMKIFGVTKQVVTARAVATNVSGVNQDCLYTLAPHPDGIGVSGGGNGKNGASVNLGNCGVVDNGDFNSGNSSNWSMTAGSFSVAGTDTGGKGAVTCTSGQSSCPVYGVPAAGNPLASFTAPPEASQPIDKPKWSNSNPQPGHYSSIDFGNNNVTLPSGNYVVDGGSVSYSGNGVITGNGVFFYLENKAAWGGSGTEQVTLTPPVAPSPYAGVLIYQNPAGCDTSCDDELAGGGNAIPNAGFSGLVVIWGLSLKGTDKLYMNGTAGYGVSLLKNAVLVE